ncbi:MAG: hypothetical protein MR698_00420 [Selenomonas sp.]|nr:hypothetical protein [Selenomonas sp.]
MNRFVSWWKSAEGSAARAGLLTALPMVAGLVLVAQMASEAGAYFPAVYVLAAALAAVGTLAFSRLRLALALGPDLVMAGWLFSLLVISHGLTLGQLYALLAVVSLLACAAVFSGLASRIVSAVPDCIRAALPVALGVMLVLWGMEQGRMLLASPVHLVMLGDFADPLAYFSLLGLGLMLGLRALGVRQAVGLGLIFTALLSFIEGFWIVPPAPFYAPEGLDRAAGLFLLAGDGDAQAFGVMATVAPWLFLALLLCFYGTWQALGTGRDVSPKQPLRVVCIMNLFAALLGMTPMTAAPESALAGEAGRAHPRAYAFGAAAGLVFLLSAAPLAKELASFPAMLVPCVIFAGFLLLARARFDWAGTDFAERAAAVCLCVLVPLTYDMALGLAVAAAAYVLLKVLEGRTADVTRTMRVFAALAVLLVFAESWLF